MLDLVDEIRTATGGALTEGEVLDLAPMLYDDLEVAVGTELARRCTAEQLAEFDRLLQAGDEPGLHEWFAKNRPDHKRVVREQLDLLLDQVAREVGLAAGPVEIA